MTMPSAPLLLFLLLSLPLSAQEPWLDAWKAATQAAVEHRFEAAVQHAIAARNQGLDEPRVQYHLGRWQFQAGDAKGSVASFDAFLKRVPDRSNSLWERGISCYYAGEFKAGAKQFEGYQTFHNNDVENAVWRYLCQQRYDGKDNSRQAILLIKNDTRVPMMAVYRLFRGDASPEVVLEALAASTSTGNQRRIETMHAHLYLGLYYDSETKPDLALKHLELAVQQFDQGDYMWSVAVVHRNLLRAKSSASQDTSRPATP